MLPVTIDYTAPFNKNAKRMVQLTGCAGDAGAIKNSDHQNTWTNQHALKEYECCAGEVKDTTTVVIREWKDACSPVSYASIAVQFHSDGSQFDFAWPSARTTHGACVWCLTA